MILKSFLKVKVPFVQRSLRLEIITKSSKTLTRVKPDSTSGLSQIMSNLKQRLYVLLHTVALHATGL